MVTTILAKSRFQTLGALVALTFATTLPSLAATATQDPAQPAAPQGQAGQPATPADPGARQGRGGFGNLAARMPFAVGQVTGGDPATGTVIISSQFGGSQTIHVSNDIRIVALVQIDVSKIKVGDTVQVQGVPREITANTITAGELPDFLTMAMRGGRGGAVTNGVIPGGVQADPNAQARPSQPQAFASATGKVTQLQPLTIALSDEVSIALKLGPNAKIMKLMPGTINNVNLGDTVFASGQAGADGTFAATGLGINVDAIAGMPGMRGFRGGFGGGPGAGGFGAGGFGGRGGRGGRRGNGQGGAGGGN